MLKSGGKVPSRVDKGPTPGHGSNKVNAVRPPQQNAARDFHPDLKKPCIRDSRICILGGTSGVVLSTVHCKPGLSADCLAGFHIPMKRSITYIKMCYRMAQHDII